MMETSPDMEFLRPFLKDEWRVAGYSVNGDTHHVLFQNPTEMRALTFQTKDETGNGQAVVVGYEESIFID
jgi:hypothetical protein